MRYKSPNWLIKLNILALPWLLFGLFTVEQATADEYQSDWGPDIGSQLTLSAPDQLGEIQTIESLRGENGLLVFFNRSADW